MSTVIKELQKRIDNHPKLKQWLWFAALWLGGLVFVVTATYPIKILFRLMK